jgi:hypothetical protein
MPAGLDFVAYRKRRSVRRRCSRVVRRLSPDNISDRPAMAKGLTSMPVNGNCAGVVLATVTAAGLPDAGVDPVNGSWLGSQIDAVWIVALWPNWSRHGAGPINTSAWITPQKFFGYATVNTPDVPVGGFASTVG